MARLARRHTLHSLSHLRTPAGRANLLSSCVSGSKPIPWAVIGYTYDALRRMSGCEAHTYLYHIVSQNAKHALAPIDLSSEASRKK
jgi:hypothetical protein